ncbi:LysM domain-containing protein [Bacillus sp. MUM 13]|uniref:LysM peptidoglycan-binding domain-containing protein n=1 Tax=Bacillus sp. MUM 13 TaxID=1678001 RepID=UPI0008F5DD71|nr:LysM domain-containing protein [Bacillus sp. MUM 13]OIK12227.1 hypothetical protein BIV59_09605 [Bacillus sp. MUM 13]
MKRLAAFIVVIFIAFIIYFDLTTGTIPADAGARGPAEAAAGAVYTGGAAEKAETSTIPFVESVIKPGDTLLSLLEQNQTKSYSIETAIADFQKLNNGIKPESIQIGKTYKIPVYK